MADTQVKQVTTRFALSWLHSQLFVTLPAPKTRFADQTIIVTGSNTGLGLESARHFVALGAAKVVLAVRSKAKGDAAKASIEKSAGRKGGVVEVWELDLSRYESVLAFAARAEKELGRLDVLVNNAGVVMYEFLVAEGNESTITVNVMSQMLLSLLLLPKLRETAVRFGKEAKMIFTSSFVHFMTEFPERKAERILDEFAVKERADMNDRYFVSKMLQLLLIRELASRITDSGKPGEVVVSAVNPGFVNTEIMRHASAAFFLLFVPWQAIAGRPAHKGARTLLHAASAGRETHGQYLSDCAVASPSDFVTSPDGNAVQKRLWEELRVLLEKIKPDVMAGL